MMRLHVYIFYIRWALSLTSYFFMVKLALAINVQYHSQTVCITEISIYQRLGAFQYHLPTIIEQLEVLATSTCFITHINLIHLVDITLILFNFTSECMICTNIWRSPRLSRSVLLHPCECICKIPSSVETWQGL